MVSVKLSKIKGFLEFGMCLNGHLSNYILTVFMSLLLESELLKGRDRILALLIFATVLKK